MAKTSLLKSKNYTFIPGTSGTSSVPGVPVAQGTPPYYSTESVSVTTCRPTLCSTAPTISSPSFSSIIGSGGHNAPQPCSQAMICTTSIQLVSTFHPATPGTPGTIGVAGISGTSAELIEHLNAGWNSHSKSIDKLIRGEYLSYYVNEGVGGVLLSIGIDGKDNNKITEFSHSILVERAGILIFENGVKIKTIRNSYTSDSLIRLYRQADNKVICVVVTGSETLIHVFDNDAHDLLNTPLNVYAHLYIADDVVEHASYKIGKVHFGEA